MLVNTCKEDKVVLETAYSIIASASARIFEESQQETSTGTTAVAETQQRVAPIIYAKEE
jgi:hypothetical protein